MPRWRPGDRDHVADAEGHGSGDAEQQAVQGGGGEVRADDLRLEHGADADEAHHRGDDDARVRTFAEDRRAQQHVEHRRQREHHGEEARRRREPAIVEEQEVRREQRQSQDREAQMVDEGKGEPTARRGDPDHHDRGCDGKAPSDRDLRRNDAELQVQRHPGRAPEQHHGAVEPVVEGREARRAGTRRVDRHSVVVPSYLRICRRLRWRPSGATDCDYRSPCEGPISRRWCRRRGRSRRPMGRESRPAAGRRRYAAVDDRVELVEEMRLASGPPSPGHCAPRARRARSSRPAARCRRPFVCGRASAAPGAAPRRAAPDAPAAVQSLTRSQAASSAASS